MIVHGVEDVSGRILRQRSCGCVCVWGDAALDGLLEDFGHTCGRFWTASLGADSSPEFAGPFRGREWLPWAWLCLLPPHRVPGNY